MNSIILCSDDQDRELSHLDDSTVNHRGVYSNGACNETHFVKRDPTGEYNKEVENCTGYDKGNSNLFILISITNSSKYINIACSIWP